MVIIDLYRRASGYTIRSVPVGIFVHQNISVYILILSGL